MDEGGRPKGIPAAEGVDGRRDECRKRGSADLAHAIEAPPHVEAGANLARQATHRGGVLGEVVLIAAHSSDAPADLGERRARLLDGGTDRGAEAVGPQALLGAAQHRLLTDTDTGQSHRARHRLRHQAAASPGRNPSG